MKAQEILNTSKYFYTLVNGMTTSTHIILFMYFYLSYCGVIFWITQQHSIKIFRNFNETNYVTLNKMYSREVNWYYSDIIHVLRTTALIIAIFRHKGDEICDLLGCYAARGDNSLQNLRDNPLIESLIIVVETEGFPETSVKNYHHTMCKITEEKKYRFSFLLNIS